MLHITHTITKSHSLTAGVGHVEPMGWIWPEKRLDLAHKGPIYPWAACEIEGMQLHHPSCMPLFAALSAVV